MQLDQSSAFGVGVWRAARARVLNTHSMTPFERLLSSHGITLEKSATASFQSVDLSASSARLAATVESQSSAEAAFAMWDSYTAANSDDLLRTLQPIDSNWYAQPHGRCEMCVTATRAKFEWILAAVTDGRASSHAEIAENARRSTARAVHPILS
jgi:hypothetical protein